MQCTVRILSCSAVETADALTSPFTCLMFSLLALLDPPEIHHVAVDAGNFVNACGSFLGFVSAREHVANFPFRVAYGAHVPANSVRGPFDVHFSVSIFLRLCVL